jgi:hypothetical protein
MGRWRPHILELLTLVALAALFWYGLRDLWDFGLALMGPLLRAIARL